MSSAEFRKIISTEYNVCMGCFRGKMILEHIEQDYCDCQAQFIDDVVLEDPETFLNEEE
jgi:hypothetical protein